MVKSNSDYALGYAMKQAQHALRKRMDEKLRPLGVTVPQYAVLNALETEPGASNAQLARQAFVTPQSMQGIISNLEKLGLIARSPDPEHGRIQKTKLTQRGQKTVRQAHAIATQIEAMLIDAIRPLEYKAVLALFQRCRDKLEGD